MIRVNKPVVGPATLNRGIGLVATMHAEVAANPAVGTETSPFEFNSNIYGHEDVKEALLAAQHKKCAYCEGSFLAFGWGDVEHYRPKGFSQQVKGGAKTRPGYYWLAYDWTNLLGSCSKCNQLRKKNLFPLSVPANRATTPAEVANEEPLVLDPSGPIDPRLHIGFQKNVPKALSAVGAATIEALALDREELNGDRLKHYQHVQALRRIIAIAPTSDHPDSQQFAVESAAELESMKQPDAEFSAVTLTYLGI